MSSIGPLEDRNLCTGLTRRTLKNLDFMMAAHQRGEDIHVVTHLVNSLLSLLVFPVEFEKKKTVDKHFAKVKLGNPPDFLAVPRRFPRFPALPSLVIHQFEKCESLDLFLERLRNAISHRHLRFSNESRKLDEVIIDFQDGPGGSINWHITLSAPDTLALAVFVANEIIALGV